MYDKKNLKISEENLDMSLALEDKMSTEISKHLDHHPSEDVHELMLVELIIPENEVVIPSVVEQDHNGVGAFQVIKEVVNPAQAAVLPHYVSIDFQGCQLNVNFYDAGAKPISPHEVIKPEIDHIDLQSPVLNDLNAACKDFENCQSVPQTTTTQEAHDSALSPAPPNQGGDMPAPPDPIWFA